MEIVGFQIHLVFSQIDYMTEKTHQKTEPKAELLELLSPPPFNQKPLGHPWAIGRSSVEANSTWGMVKEWCYWCFLIFIGC